MKTIFANEDNTKRSIYDRFDSILHGRLLSIDAIGLSDEEIVNRIVPYSERPYNFPDNFCTWIEIGDIVERCYYIKYNVITIDSQRLKAFEINFSTFRTSMTPLNGMEVITPLKKIQSVCRCEVDENTITPDSFFPQNKGEKMLLFYSFPAINQNNKETRCYLFAKNYVSPLHLRHYILCAQLNAINCILSNPAYYGPDVLVKQILGGVETLLQRHTCDGNEQSRAWAFQIFDDEFKTRFLSKRKLIIDSLNIIRKQHPFP